MKMEALVASWMAEAESIARLVKDDFMPLNEQQLTYRVHVSQCNIRQLMEQVLSNNRRLLDGIEQAIPFAKATKGQQEYQPGFMGKYILDRMASARCNTKETKDQGVDVEDLSPEMLFLKITGQQNRFKELVTLCMSVDMNSSMVPFRLHGLIRLSIGEALEYLVLYQKRRFIMARHMVMLQGVRIQENEGVRV